MTLVQNIFVSLQPNNVIEMKLMKTKFLCGLALLALGVTSCKDNAVFDQNTYNQLVLNSFPVKNVDPAQSWTTV